MARLVASSLGRVGVCASIEPEWKCIDNKSTLPPKRFASSTREIPAPEIAAVIESYFSGAPERTIECP